jgi:hypothetical protein
MSYQLSDLEKPVDDIIHDKLLKGKLGFIMNTIEKDRYKDDRIPNAERLEKKVNYKLKQFVDQVKERNVEPMMSIDDKKAPSYPLHHLIDPVDYEIHDWLLAGTLGRIMNEIKTDSNMDLDARVNLAVRLQEIMKYKLNEFVKEVNTLENQLALRSYLNREIAQAAVIVDGRQLSMQQPGDTFGPRGPSSASKKSRVDGSRLSTRQPGDTHHRMTTRKRSAPGSASGGKRKSRSKSRKH